jgi:hypothetical protein
MSNTRSARYHRRRKARLIARIGGEHLGCLPVCAKCGYGPQDGTPLQIAHMRGNGGVERKARGNAGEITRLLSLPEEILLDEVTLMCEPCHVAHDTAAGYLVRF